MTFRLFYCLSKPQLAICTVQFLAEYDSLELAQTNSSNLVWQQLANNRYTSVPQSCDRDSIEYYSIEAHVTA